MTRRRKLPPGIYLDDATGKYGINTRINGEQFRRKGFTSPDEAEETLHEARKRGRRGQRIPDAGTARLTFADLAVRYSATHEWSNPRTEHNYRGSIAHLVAVFGAASIHLRASHVVEWMDRFEGSHGTLRNHLGMLNRMLDWAVLDELLDANPVRSIRLPAVKTKPRRQVLADAAITEWIDALGPRYQLAAWLMIGLGVRSGEARGITVDDVDRDAGTIRVETQIIRGRESTTERDDPKYNQRRTIAADPWLLAVIDEHLEEFPAGPAGELITSVKGLALSESAWTSAMRDASRRSDHKITGHLLRHAYVTKLVRAGVPPVQVADDTGHTPATMHRTYVDADPTPDAARSTRALDGIARRKAHQKRTLGHLRVVSDSA